MIRPSSGRKWYAILYVALACFIGVAAENEQLYAAAQPDPYYTCPTGFYGAGNMSIMGNTFVVSGYGAKLTSLPYLPAYPGIPRASYNFPAGWHYTPQGTVPRVRFKASTWDARCYCVVQPGGICIGPLAGDQWYNFTLETASDEEELNLCADGSYVDDPSGCPSGGEGGGPSSPPPGAGGGGSGLPPNNPPTDEYFICFFTWWSDGTWEADCYGPYGG
jgi:hypothetical protein